MRNLALGRYLPYNTAIHRLDARVKIIGLISLVVALFLSYGSVPLNFIVYGLIFVGLFIVMLIGKISFKGVLRSMRAMLVMMIFILIFNVFVPGTGDYFLIHKLKVYYSAIYNTLYIILRLFLMIMLTSVLTATTKPMDLTFAIESLLTPLKWIKIKVSIFAMIISLALRFIPSLMEETDRIMKAQASRGVDFREGKFKEKIKSIDSLIIPVFNSALTRSGDLAIAMECRGYDPHGKRTKFKKLSWSLGDTIFLIVMLLVFAGAITLAVFGMKYDIFSLFIGLFK